MDNEEISGKLNIEKVMLEKGTDLEGLIKIKVNYEDSEERDGIVEEVKKWLKKLALNKWLKKVGRNKNNNSWRVEDYNKEITWNIFFHGKSHEKPLDGYVKNKNKGLKTDINMLKKLFNSLKNQKKKDNQKVNQMTDKQYKTLEKKENEVSVAIEVFYREKTGSNYETKVTRMRCVAGNCQEENSPSPEYFQKRREDLLTQTEFFKSKQSDQLNAMIVVGLSYIFGFFNILDHNVFVLIPFTVLVLVIFLYFYERFRYYTLAEVTLEYQADINYDYGIIVKTLSNERPDILAPVRLYFWKDKKWFNTVRMEANKETLKKGPFSYWGISPKTRLESFLIVIVWIGYTLLSWYFLPNPYFEKILIENSPEVLCSLVIDSLIILISFLVVLGISVCITLWQRKKYTKYKDENKLRSAKQG